MAEAGLFGQAIQVAQKIEDGSWGLFALFLIAEAMAKVGLFEQAIQLAQKGETTFGHSEALSFIADAMEETGVKDQALWTQTLQLAQNIEGSPFRSLVFIPVARAMAKTIPFEQAFKLAKGVEQPIFRLQALAAIVAEMKKARMMKE